MKSLSAIAIVAALFVSTAALAEGDTGQAITGAPTDGTKDALEVVIDGDAAQNIYESMKIDAITLSQGAMTLKRGPNISCYASVEIGMYLCDLEVNSDGTTKGRQ